MLYRQSESYVQSASDTVADLKLTSFRQDVVPESGTSLPLLTPFGEDVRKHESP